MSDPFTLDEEVTCIAETDKAILVQVDGENCWVPKGQVHDDSEVYAENHVGKLVVTAWFARKVGWL